MLNMAGSQSKFILKLEKVFFYILPITCIILYFWTVIGALINIPYRDDYDAILNFANVFFHSNFYEKLLQIFSQHNEHRIIFCRVMTLISYFLFGRIDLRFITIISNTSLLGLTAVFLISTVFSGTRIKFIYFIPAVFLIFQLQYLETSIITNMAAASNLVVLLPVFLSLYLLTVPFSTYFLLSLLLAIFATFTNGNGMFVFLAGFVSLLLQKRYSSAILWFLAAILSVSLYFFGYSKPPYHPAIILAVSASLFETIKYFFVFLGCFLGSLAKIYFFGICMLAYFIYLSITRYYQKNPAIFSFLIFLFITAAVVSVCRSGFGIQQAISSRYTIITIQIIICFYFSLVENLPEKVMKRIFPVFLALSMLFNLSTYKVCSEHIIENKKNLKKGLSLWKKYGYGLEYPDQDKASSIITNAMKNGFYSPPL